MFRLVSNISFTRKAQLVFNFVHEFECSDGWHDLTNNAKITLAKNVFARDQFGKAVPLSGNNINIGGFSDNVPLFLRGDKVVIQAGYRFYDQDKREQTKTATFFTGFISNVSSKKPMVIECEDNMWKLKQIPAPNKVFKASQYKLEDILKELLAGTGFTVNTLTNTSFGDFKTENETVCEVLARLRKDYHFESYFRGNELRCGAVVYLESDAIESGKKVFRFQDNIIEDELEYRRKDDIRLSAVAYSINKVALANGFTKAGKQKTRHERLQVLVTQQGDKFVRKVKLPAERQEFAENTIGERRSLYFWNVTDPVVLGNLAVAELQKYYYTGFKGKFTTFGLPFVRMGDNVDILDKILPERNGRYKVKQVDYSGGVNGLRQEIELEYLVTRLDSNGNTL